METFSLLKYWRRRRGSGDSVTIDGGANVRTTNTTSTVTTTIVTDVSPHSFDTDGEDEDGTFFDMEFTVDDGNDDNSSSGDDADENKDDGETESDVSDGENDGRELKFMLSSGSSGDRTDPDVSLSPSDDLFVKGCLVPVESSSLELSGSEPNYKSQFPVSLLRSATKFRVLMLKLKKSKSNVVDKTESNGKTSPPAKSLQKNEAEKKSENQNQTGNKFFTVKFKVEEMPIVSLFTRDNSSKSANIKAQKENTDDSASDEKRFSKDVMQRYLKMVKPLYIRVSKRYGDKLSFSGQLGLSGSAAKAGPSQPSVALQKLPWTKSTTVKSETESQGVSEMPKTNNVKIPKQGNLQLGLRMVCKHLGKSKSASSTVPPGPIASKRRDDLLLQQHDEIQSAILHCKRSFNASIDSDLSILSRSVSDPSHEKFINLSTVCSSDEAKKK